MTIAPGSTSCIPAVNGSTCLSAQPVVMNADGGLSFQALDGSTVVLQTGNRQQIIIDPSSITATVPLVTLASTTDSIISRGDLGITANATLNMRSTDRDVVITGALGSTIQAQNGNVDALAQSGAVNVRATGGNVVLTSDAKQVQIIGGNGVAITSNGVGNVAVDTPNAGLLVNAKTFAAVTVNNGSFSAFSTLGPSTVGGYTGVNILSDAGNAVINATVGAVSMTGGAGVMIGATSVGSVVINTVSGPATMTATGGAASVISTAKANLIGATGVSLLLSGGRCCFIHHHW